MMSVSIFKQLPGELTVIGQGCNKFPNTRETMEKIRHTALRADKDLQTKIRVRDEICAEQAFIVITFSSVQREAL